MSYDENQMRVSEENSLDNEISNDSTTLLIEDIVDLTAQRNLESSSETVETVQAISSADLDYDLQDILNSFLERENQNNGSQ